MEIPKVRFSSLIDQRYFHFIVLRKLGDRILTNYLSNIGKSITIERQDFNLANLNFDIQHNQVTSDIPYTRGLVLENVSTSKDGMPPYNYDLFSFRIESKAQTLFVFAFPFASLGRDIVDNLIANKSGILLKVEVPKLIKIGEREQNLLKEPLRTHIVGFHVVIVDDPTISSLSLGGDDPLKSDIYRDYLKSSIYTDKIIPDQCVLACELLDSKEMSTRARIHMDAFGNFKFYVHIKTANLVAIPFLLQKLSSLKCFDEISTNPLRRIQEETNLQ